MPVPIIQRQRALSQVGEIRIGGEKGDKAPGRKLDSFRLTSQYREIIDTAAGLYGGEPQPWESPVGSAWQVYTESSSLPCMVIVGYSLTRMYELWEGATKCVRRCDGIEEQISGGPCVCNAEGNDRCDTVTRLMVLLPETGTSLGWRLRSTGEIAADELDGAMMVANKLAAGRAFVPATLRLTQRRSVSGGQTKRYVVPVLDFNLIQGARVAAAIEPPAGYTPLPAADTGVTVAEALELTAGPAAPRPTTSRSAAPIPEIADVPFGDDPVPVQDDTAPGAATETPKATQAQTRKLNVLVGKLRDNNKITTDQLWAAMAKARNVPADTMMELLDGRDEQGESHWSPLRDSLTKVEASDLIEHLSKLEERATACSTCCGNSPTGEPAS